MFFLTLVLSGSCLHLPQRVVSKARDSICLVFPKCLTPHKYVSCGLAKSSDLPTVTQLVSSARTRTLVGGVLCSVFLVFAVGASQSRADGREGTGPMFQISRAERVGLVSAGSCELSDQGCMGRREQQRVEAASA